MLCSPPITILLHNIYTRTQKQRFLNRNQVMVICFILQKHSINCGTAITTFGLKIEIEAHTLLAYHYALFVTIFIYCNIHTVPDMHT